LATPSTSATRPNQPDRGLADGLIALAGTPDDASNVPDMLRSIAQLAADLLPQVNYASMTVQQEDNFTTVAMSSEVALAVDEAQYTDQAGPCLDALRTSRPTALPHIDTTVSWPRFRETAYQLGLRASLSIPLFAGRGLPIAALNLYSRDSTAMAPLCAAVVEVFHRSPTDGLDPEPLGLGAGGVQLLEGLIGAFAVRAKIQQALGVIMASERRNADLAYATLRSRAAGSTLSLMTAANAVLASTGEQL
jgi:hypothetical protein